MQVFSGFFARGAPAVNEFVFGSVFESASTVWFMGGHVFGFGEAPCAEASLFDFLEGGIGRESDRLHKGAPPHRVGSFIGTHYARGPCS